MSNGLEIIPKLFMHGQIVLSISKYIYSFIHPKWKKKKITNTYLSNIVFNGDYFTLYYHSLVFHLSTGLDYPRKYLFYALASWFCSCVTLLVWKMTTMELFLMLFLQHIVLVNTRNIVRFVVIFILSSSLCSLNYMHMF